MHKYYLTRVMSFYVFLQAFAATMYGFSKHAIPSMRSMNAILGVQRLVKTIHCSRFSCLKPIIGVYLIIICTFFCSSCAHYYGSNGELKYLSSQNGPDLVVPSPLSDSNISYFYNLPSQTQNPAVSIQPPNDFGRKL